ncbi:hypothetical protein O59_002089 [Cellvibrio sp. BR]|nr:hypothetical protein O59_002089 [Cellvibrio sp. BR]
MQFQVGDFYRVSLNQSVGFLLAFASVLYKLKKLYIFR